jgi:hypothetical protein
MTVHKFQSQSIIKEQDNPTSVDSMPKCLPSPTPTELLMTSDEIAHDIQAMGIKVRDFTYEQTSAAPVKLIFDCEFAIAEHDFCLAEVSRTRPIPGQNLRRLLDIGWVSIEEGRARWSTIDWLKLEAHDSRPRYPWCLANSDKARPCPSMQERKNILFNLRLDLHAIKQAYRLESMQLERE